MNFRNLKPGDRLKGKFKGAEGEIYISPTIGLYPYFLTNDPYFAAGTIPPEGTFEYKYSWTVCWDEDQWESSKSFDLLPGQIVEGIGKYPMGHANGFLYKCPHSQLYYFISDCNSLLGSKPLDFDKLKSYGQYSWQSTWSGEYGSYIFTPTGEPRYAFMLPSSNFKFNIGQRVKFNGRGEGSDDKPPRRIGLVSGATAYYYKIIDRTYSDGVHWYRTDLSAHETKWYTEDAMDAEVLTGTVTAGGATTCSTFPEGGTLHVDWLSGFENHTYRNQADLNDLVNRIKGIRPDAVFTITSGPGIIFNGLIAKFRYETAGGADLTSKYKLGVDPWASGMLPLRSAPLSSPWAITLPTGVDKLITVRGFCIKNTSDYMQPPILISRSKKKKSKLIVI